MSVRYVVVSDLHLGARESVLTHCDGQGKILDGPGPVMAAFGAALRQTLTALVEGEEKVTLVLLGDALDLGLTPFGDVSTSFLQLLDALLPEGQPSPIAHEIVYLPGNHDHHMWRMAQDHAYVLGLEAGTIAPDIAQVSPLLGGTDFNCTMLEALMRRRADLAEGKVTVCYPNWAIWSDDRRRAVALHHGHYVDSMYRALSSLRGWLVDDPAPLAEIAGLERENGPWIDFLWSNLGSAGAIGTGADTLYETMLDAGASHDFAQTLARRVVAQLHQGLGISPDTELKYGLTIGELIQAGIDFTASRGAEQQRDSYASVLMGAEIDDLRWYLGGPLRRQFTDQLDADKIEDLSFVFGHTHKPFQDQLVIAPWQRPVSIFNTGGWVLDEPMLRPVQGAAAILIDDSADVVSLRLFNNPTNGVMAPVHIADAGARGGAQGTLREAASAAVAGAAAPWAAFSDTVRERIEQIAHQRVCRFLKMEWAALTPAREPAA